MVFSRLPVRHVSLRSAKYALGVASLCWIGVILMAHDKLALQYKQLEKNTVAVHRYRRTVDAVLCDKVVINITQSECAQRLRYIQQLEGRNECFEKFGVLRDADECAIFKYLIYFEKICPEPTQATIKLSWYGDKTNLLRTGKLHLAKWTKDLSGLVQKMQQCGEVCSWMARRLESMSGEWQDAIAKLVKEKQMITTSVDESSKYSFRRQQTILLHMGLLTTEFGLNFGEGAFAGGPLGELVQWTDLAASLHLLGHKVILSWSPQTLKEILKPEYTSANSCIRGAMADIVYTDLNGLGQIQHILGTLQHYRCKLRILDVFGTEPEFNHPRYKNNRSGTWGGRGLDPKQFFTQYPHTPDNSFLGFAVSRKSVPNQFHVKKDTALLYGKRTKYFFGRSNHVYLNIIREYFPDILATVTDKEGKSSDIEYDDIRNLPDYVINHGSLPQDEFTYILRSSRIYVGFGWPVEGPAALEAIANGVTFLNPKFSPPLDAHDGKPTSRRLTSQNPYVEGFIGEPHVYTVDISDEVQLRETLKKIKESDRPMPKITMEFTHFGFLERLNAYLENQDFCTSEFDSDVDTTVTWKRNNKVWPPESDMQVVKSNDLESCVATCSRLNLTCERAYFPILNNTERLEENGVRCTTTKAIPSRVFNHHKNTVSELCHAPSYDLLTSSCFTQWDELLFSCACATPKNLVRLCPCRSYKREQIALCPNCI